MVYYVYSKRSGRLITKTTSIDVLNEYVPSLVDIVIYG